VRKDARSWAPGTAFRLVLFSLPEVLCGIVYMLRKNEGLVCVKAFPSILTFCIPRALVLLKPAKPVEKRKIEPPRYYVDGSDMHANMYRRWTGARTRLVVRWWRDGGARGLVWGRINASANFAL
jgi:hypothetical protein